MAWRKWYGIGKERGKKGGGKEEQEEPGQALPGLCLPLVCICIAPRMCKYCSEFRVKDSVGKALGSKM